jgi:chromosome segregation ATPase
MVLICCISPLPSHVEESHNTFKFATRAKKIPQKATIQESVDEKTLLQTYREEIEALRQQLREAKKQQEALLSQQQMQQKQQQKEQQEPVEADEEDIDDEVEELKRAIKSMEHLILKSKAATPPSGSVSRTLSDEMLDSVDISDDDEEDEAALLALMTETEKSSGTKVTPVPQTPPPRDGDADHSGDMYNELHRIQGLLGSVLKKRGKGQKGGSPIHASNKTAETLNGNIKNTAEVTKLRAQLEEQEVASSLRKADAHFLQKQLEEKDDLLQEVSKILEQVEQRQVELEAENAALKKELAKLKNASPTSPTQSVEMGRVLVDV